MKNIHSTDNITMMVKTTAAGIGSSFHVIDFSTGRTAFAGKSWIHVTNMDSCKLCFIRYKLLETLIGPANLFML